MRRPRKAEYRAMKWSLGAGEFGINGTFGWYCSYHWYYSPFNSLIQKRLKPIEDNQAGSPRPAYLVMSTAVAASPLIDGGADWLDTGQGRGIAKRRGIHQDQRRHDPKGKHGVKCWQNAC